ncbi:hypothetical protein [Streptomyces sp. NBC_00582]|uniref:hypothetical protein n=1 Tax=Streptomyces sp. NBC_00582 TaxID=2975783 RepID=UPI002E81B672|nr:hypothetical protein [Streptomyces sp. NBC_00582]WUB62793.1 hypothetical protein OG852_21525 [Streptomyces sp. NBC_00582]
MSPTPDGVVVATTRGFVSVGRGGEEGPLRVGVGIPDFSWAIGSTDDLGVLVEAVAAWRERMPLDELRQRFEFLELDEFTDALERGEPTASQWSGLLSSDFHRGQWDLLRRIHADEVLRTFFPTISHGAVRLRVDPLDGASRQVLVAEVVSERYDVMQSGTKEAIWVEVPSDALITHLRAALK